MASETIILNDITARSLHTWGYIGGTTTLRGDVLGWRFGIGPDHAALINANATVLKTGDTFASAGLGRFLHFSEIPGPQVTWMAIPIAAEGWRTFYAALTHTLNVGVEVSSYLFPNVDGSLSSSASLITPLAFVQTLSEGTELPNSAAGGKYNVSPGGIGRAEFAQTPLGILVLRVEILGNPTEGDIRLGVERQQ